MGKPQVFSGQFKRFMINLAFCKVQVRQGLLQRQHMAGAGGELTLSRGECRATDQRLQPRQQGLDAGAGAGRDAQRLVRQRMGRRQQIGLVVQPQLAKLRVEQVCGRRMAGLRIARLGGWFARNLDPDLRAGLDGISAALEISSPVELPQAEQSRRAAFVMTAMEGGFLHRQALRTNPDGFDPAVRDRLLAGLLQPAEHWLQVQRFAEWFGQAMARLWQHLDVLIAPAVPCVAPRIDQASIEVDGQQVSARANLGMFTQPLGLAGCPVLAVPLHRPGRLPLGVQLVAADGRNITVTQNSAGTLTAASTGLNSALVVAQAGATATAAENNAGTFLGSVTLSSVSAFTIERGTTTGAVLKDSLGLNVGTYGAGRSGQALDTIDLGTADGATAALTAIDNALSTVNSARADQGAIQNRFGAVTANIASTSET